MSYDTGTPANQTQPAPCRHRVPPLLRVIALLGIACVGGAATLLAGAGSAAPAAGALYLPLIVDGGAGPPADGRPSWSSPIALSADDSFVWVVNPDAGTVTVLETAQHTIVAEAAAGREPRALALAGGRAYVVDQAGGALLVLDAATLAVVATIPVGPEPTAVALSPTGATAYVAVMAAAGVAVVDLHSFAVRRRIATPDKPYALAVSDDGDGEDGDEQIYVTHLLARPGGEGVVSVVDAGGESVVAEIALPANEQGFPNLLTGIALGGGRAWLPHVRAAPALPQGLTTTVFAAVSAVDLAARQEDAAAYLPLNDEQIFGSPVNNPVAAVPSPDGRRLYIVLAGSDLLEVVDIANPHAPRLVAFLATGRNPLGLALTGDGRRGYVMNYLSRSITVYDLDRLAVLDEIAVTAETLDPQVLRGKILFNTATDPRLTRGAWISCASCHFAGLPDGITWIFPDGPRQTPALWNAGQTLPWHWSAALDEAQDVEETIQRIQHGIGLAPGRDPPNLGAPNAGRAADLDALAAFLTGGIRPAAVAAEAEEAAGRALFVAQGCAACHGGPHWTASALPGPAGALDGDGNGMVDGVLYDVGTGTAADVRGAGGFDVPSLLGVGLTAPYLHDGSAQTLEALLAGGHPPGATPLAPRDRASLVAFLRSIGPQTAPVEPATAP